MHAALYLYQLPTYYLHSLTVTRYIIYIYIYLFFYVPVLPGVLPYLLCNYNLYWILYIYIKFKLPLNKNFAYKENILN